MIFARSAWLTGIAALLFLVPSALTASAAEPDRVEARFEIYGFAGLHVINQPDDDRGVGRPLRDRDGARHPGLGEHVRRFDQPLESSWEAGTRGRAARGLPLGCPPQWRRTSLRGRFSRRRLGNQRLAPVSRRAAPVGCRRPDARHRRSADRLFSARRGNWRAAALARSSFRCSTAAGCTTSVLPT